ncbi:TetR/AcrR family transcriptional regulator [Paenibacillus sp.]|uniref:TetR/AcrR family transcriptional regulator n=1 Tax=Paenibacillus sp. TaxID=58172 RepID=UPI002D5EF798|nr:TetR family transcriptional regulator [Paenibacillus sp.]HZG85444.1 TetR family transcriptional regulator [Paenibacillus sp.]
MANGRTPRQQQAEETKNRLIDSALKVFSTKGFAASTTKDIAKEAGVTDGLIYHYFKSKQDLIWAILERHTLVHHIQGMLAGLKPEMSTTNIVQHYVRSLFQMLKQNNDLIVLIYGEAQRDPDIRDRLAGIVSGGAKPLAAALAGRSRLDEDALRHAVRNLQFAVVQYYLILYRTRPDEEELEHYLTATANQFVTIIE